MAKKLVLWVRSNRGLIILTFEVFWILVFLLDRATRTNAVEIPQFIYVKF